jgi:hypothetical protein
MRNRLNRLFWSANQDVLDVERDRDEIIHHTLAYGSVEDIRYLLRLYSRPIVKKSFLEGRPGYYSPQAVAFAQSLFSIPKLNFSHYTKRVKGTPLRNPRRIP